MLQRDRACINTVLLTALATILSKAEAFVLPSSDSCKSSRNGNGGPTSSTTLTDADGRLHMVVEEAGEISKVLGSAPYLVGALAAAQLALLNKDKIREKIESSTDWSDFQINGSLGLSVMVTALAATNLLMSPFDVPAETVAPNVPIERVIASGFQNAEVGRMGKDFEAYEYEAKIREQAGRMAAESEAKLNELRRQLEAAKQQLRAQQNGNNQQTAELQKELATVKESLGATIESLQRQLASTSASAREFEKKAAKDKEATVRNLMSQANAEIAKVRKEMANAQIAEQKKIVEQFAREKDAVRVEFQRTLNDAAVHYQAEAASQLNQAVQKATNDYASKIEQLKLEMKLQQEDAVSKTQAAVADARERAIRDAQAQSAKQLQSVESSLASELQAVKQQLRRQSDTLQTAKGREESLRLELDKVNSLLASSRDREKSASIGTDDALAKQRASYVEILEAQKKQSSEAIGAIRKEVEATTAARDKALMAVNSARDELAKANSAASAKVDDLKRQIDDTEKRTLAAAKSDYEASLRDLSTRLKAKEAELANVASASSGNSVEFTKLQNQYSDLQSKYATLQTRTNELATKAQSEIKTLASNRDGLRAELEQSKKRQAEATAAKEQAVNEARSLAAEQLQTAKSRFASELLAVKEQLQQQSDALQDAQGRRDVPMQAELENLKSYALKDKEDALTKLRVSYEAMLEAQRKQSNEYIGSMKNQIDTTTAARDQALMAVKSIQDELKRANSVATARIDELTRQVANGNEALATTKTANDAALKELLARLEANEKEFVRMDAAGSAADVAFTKLQAQYSELQSKYDIFETQAKGQASNAKTEIQTLSASRDGLLRELEQSKKLLADAAAAKKQAVKDALEQSGLATELASVKEQLNKQSIALQNARGREESFQVEVDKVKNSALAAKEEALEEQRVSYEAMLGAQKKQSSEYIASIKREVEATTAARDEALLTVSTIRDELAKANSASTTKVNKLKQEVAVAQKNLDEAIEAKIAKDAAFQDLASRFKTKEAEFAKISAADSDAKSELTILRTQNSELQSKFTTFETKTKELALKSQKEIQSLSVNRDDLRAELEQSKKLLAEAAIAKEKAVKLAQSRAAEIDSIRTNVDSTTADREKALLTANSARDELEKANSALTAKVNNLLQEVGVAEKNLDEAVAAKLSTDVAFQDLSSRFKAKDAELTKFVAANSGLRAELEQSKTLQVQAAEQTKRLLAEASVVKEQAVKEAQSRAEQLQAVQSGMALELQTVKEQLQQTAGQEESLQAELAKVKSYSAKAAEDAIRLQRASFEEKLEAQKKQSSESIVSLKKEVEATTAARDEALMTIKSIQTELEKKNSAATAKLDELKQQVADTEASQKAALAAAKAEYDAAIKDLSIRLSSREAEMANIASAGRDSNAAFANLQTEYSELQSQHSALQTKYDTFQAESNALTTKAQAGVLNLSANRDGLLEELQQTKRLQAETAVAFQTAKEQLQKQGDAFQTVREALLTSQSREGSLQAELDKVKSYSSKATDDALEQQRAFYEVALEAQKKQSSDSIDSIRMEVDAITASRDDALATVDTIRAELEAATSAATATVGDLKQQVAAVKADYDAAIRGLSARSESKESEFGSVASSPSDNSAEFIRLQAQYSELLTNRDSLQAELEKSKELQVNAALANEQALKDAQLKSAQQLQLVRSELESELQAMKEQLQQQSDALQTVQGREDSLQAKLGNVMTSTSKGTDDALEQQRASFEKKLETQKRQSSETIASIRKEADAAATARDEAVLDGNSLRAELTETNAATNAKVEELKQEVDEMERSKKEALAAANSEYNAAIKDLSARLESKEEEFASRTSSSNGDNAELTNLKKRYLDLEANRDALQADLEQTKKLQAEADLANKESRNDAQVQSAKQLQAVKSELASEIQALKDLLQQQTIALQTAQDREKSLQAELENAKSNLSETSDDILRQQRASFAEILEAQKKQSSEAVDSIRKEYRDETLASVNSIRDELVKANSAAAAKIDELNQQVAEAKKSREAALSAAKLDYDAALQDLATRLEAKEAALANIVAAGSDAEAEFIKLQTKFSELQSKYDESQTQTKAISSQAKTEIQRLLANRDELQAELDQSKKLQTGIDASTTSIEASKARYQQNLQQALTDNAKEIEAMKQKVLSHKAAMSDSVKNAYDNVFGAPWTKKGAAITSAVPDYDSLVQQMPKFQTKLQDTTQIDAMQQKALADNTERIERLKQKAMADKETMTEAVKKGYVAVTEQVETAAQSSIDAMKAQDTVGEVCSKIGAAITTNFPDYVSLMHQMPTFDSKLPDSNEMYAMRQQALTDKANQIKAIQEGALADMATVIEALKKGYAAATEKADAAVQTATKVQDSAGAVWAKTGAAAAAAITDYERMLQQMPKFDPKLQDTVQTDSTQPSETLADNAELIDELKLPDAAQIEAPQQNSLKSSVEQIEAIQQATPSDKDSMTETKKVEAPKNLKQNIGASWVPSWTGNKLWGQQGTQ